MHLLDWTIIVAYLAWVLYDGVKRARGTGAVDGYFLASRSLPWWAVGLSVMATQMSAITLVGTTGQGYDDGIRFVQFYFGLPLAMIILSVTLVPFFHRARVFTAYEYLERRFDARTRALTSLLFLVSRGLGAGVTIAAPAVILSIVLGWSLPLTILAIGIPTTLYTMLGGVQAVTWADVKQMVVIMVGVTAAVAALIVGLPDDVSLEPALHVAGATGRLQAIDFTFDLNETYTFWSGLIGGLFLALGYFGCDQSQVQRYLTAKSVDAGRQSLLLSAFAKIPLQVLILTTGVLVFCFYLFTEPPMLFNASHEAAVEASARAGEYRALDDEFRAAHAHRRADAAAVVAARQAGDDGAAQSATAAFVESDGRVNDVRARARDLVRDVTGDAAYSDVNYVFPTFITTHLPVGLVGLLIAAIFAAAMSSIAAELNALSAASTIDFYRRHFRPGASDAHYLIASKLATGFWGIFAAIIALYAANLGSLIEVVNRFGSFFYGSLLGVFVLAVGMPRATAGGAFWGLIGGMASVAVVATFTDVSFMWHNLVGVAAVCLIGWAEHAWPARPTACAVDFAQVVGRAGWAASAEPQASDAWCRPAPSNPGRARVTDNCIDEPDPPDQPRRAPALPGRGVGARRVQGVVGSGYHGRPGAADDLRVRERLPQPERRLRRHRCGGAGRTGGASACRSFRRGGRGGAAVDSRQLQPSGPALSSDPVARDGGRPAPPGRLGSRQRDATASRTRRRRRTRPVLGPGRLLHRRRGAARRHAPAARSADGPRALG